MPDYISHPASYRDPSGFVFRSGAHWYRQVNASYRDDYLHLMQSGLYRELTAKGLLLPHSEVEENFTGSFDWFKTLLPEQLRFISYPEEWSPAQLKDAALCTLAITRLSITHGMILKDATPRNMQFPAGRPVLIDSLSFERYDASHPWVAYRQFCECFLYPLYLHHYHGLGTHKLLIAWPDGIPAGITSRLLPFRSRLKLGVWLHVFLPAIVHRRLKKDDPPTTFDRNKLLHLLSNLEDIVRKLDTQPSGDPGWSEYYEKGILSKTYLQEKERLFSLWIDSIDFASALDLGANDGHFSRILAEKKANVIAVDADWRCVQTLYRSMGKDRSIQAVCVDIANPTPASGFDHREKASFSDRAVSDLVAALALLHHLVLGQNIPLPMIAGYLATLTRSWLIIEFIPLSDEKSMQLIRDKSAYPVPYDQSAFETHFASHFTIERRAIIPGTDRVIYLMRKKGL
jgi:hypothetical protein